MKEKAKDSSLDQGDEAMENFAERLRYITSARTEAINNLRRMMPENDVNLIGAWLGYYNALMTSVSLVDESRRAYEIDEIAPLREEIIGLLSEAQKEVFDEFDGLQSQYLQLIFFGADNDLGVLVA